MLLQKGRQQFHKDRTPEHCHSRNPKAPNCRCIQYNFPTHPAHHLHLGDQAVRIGSHQLYCNVDYLKVAVLDALDEVGCKYLVHTQAVDAVVENNRITGVVAGTKEGLATIRARAFVDCTGDADVACFAGAETMKEVGSLSPNTLCLNLGNVSRRDVRKAKIRDIVEKARKKYPLIPASWGLSTVANSHHFYINHAGTRDLGQFDTTDPWQRSQAECLSRRQVVQMTQAMREFGGEEIKDIELIGAGTQIGVRETRRMLGDYVMNERDCQAGVKNQDHRDIIAITDHAVDIHGRKGRLYEVPNGPYGVPYRCLLPLGVDNLFVASRAASFSHIAASSCRLCRTMMTLGQAAGNAAAMAVSERLTNRQVDIGELQKRLVAQGVAIST